MSYATLRPKPACLAAILLAATLSSIACDPGSTGINTFIAEEPFSYSMDVVDQVGLSLEAINGNIRVTGVVDATTVTVEGTLLVWSSSQEDAEAGLADLDVAIEEGAEEILVSTEQPESSNRAYAVDYEIRLPDDFAVSILSFNGEIIVEFVRQRVELSAVNTNVNLDEVEGNVAIQVVNGDVGAEVTMRPGGAVTIVVGNGDITLEIPTNTSADIYFEVPCCGWDFDNLDVQNLEVSGPGVWPPTVTGTLGAGDGSISLAVGNGLINVVGT